MDLLIFGLLVLKLEMKLSQVLFFFWGISSEFLPRIGCVVTALTSDDPNRKASQSGEPKGAERLFTKKEVGPPRVFQMPSLSLFLCASTGKIAYEFPSS